MGYVNFAWFVLLFPYILLFVLLLFGAAEIRNTTEINDASVAIVVRPNNDAFSGMPMRF
jgi:hypothetical protein